MKYLALLAYCVIVLWSVSCAGPTPAKIDVTLTNDKGEVAYRVKGTYERGESWMEANLGPVGSILEQLAKLVGAYGQNKVVTAAP